MNKGVVGLLAIACGIAWGQDAPSSVAGVVTNSLTGAPIPRVHVSVRYVGRPQAPDAPTSYGAATDGEGKFLFPSVPPGPYSITLERAGFVLDPAQVRNLNFQLGKGEKKDNLKLSLTPTGAISGHVLDSEGAPAMGVTVSAESSAGGSGTSVPTDDLGAFRLSGLRPGKYRIKAAPLNVPMPPEVRSDGSKPEHYSPTYYPGSLTQKGGARIEVLPAAELSGMDIRLVATPIVAVSGRVNGIPPGTRGVFVRGRDNATGNMLNGSVNPDGTFVVWRVDPGKYTMLATLNASPDQRMQSVPIDLEVTSASIEHLELTLAPPVDLAGQVRYEDPEARQGPPQQAVQQLQMQGSQAKRIILRSLDPYIGYGSSMAEIGADDSFTLRNVMPGRYRIQPTWPKVYVKSMRLGSTDMDGDVLEVRGGSGGNLTLALSSQTCEVWGMVTDSKGPAGRARVVLLQWPAVPLGGGSQMTMTKDDGTYQFTGVTPGKYMLISGGDEVLSAAMTGRDLDDYTDFLQSVDLRAGDKTSRDLKVAVVK